MTHNLKRALSIGAITILGHWVSSCGGGDSIAGIEGTGDIATASGTVTGFGSVYVNGIHFNTDNARIYIDGEPASEEDLSIGMVVTVEGGVSTDGKEGIAQTIYVDKILEGTIESVTTVDYQRKTLKVLGQTVFITEDSAFNNTSFNQIAAGQRIAISGFNASSGSVAATYVEAVSTPAAYAIELEGFISTIDLANNQFALNELTVDFSQAAFIDGAGIGSASTGSTSEQIQLHTLVEVEGMLDEQTGVVQATEITFKPHYKPASSSVIFEGVVDDVDGDLMLTLNGTTVDFEWAEQLPGTLTKGSRVVVSGNFEDDILYAKNVTIKSQDQDLFRGNVSAIDESQNQFTLFNTIFEVDNLTAFEDRGPQGDRYFNLAHVRINDALEVFAIEKNGRWVATRIRRDSAMYEPINPTLRGEVEEVLDNARFVVMGVEVDGTALPADALASLTLGADVFVEGEFSSEFDFRATHIEVLEELSCRKDVFFDCFYNHEGPAPKKDFDQNEFDFDEIPTEDFSIEHAHEDVLIEDDFSPMPSRH